ncbi:MAG: 3-deoxy-7-phosphoheptulonate synthase [Bacillota bacterium]|nr:3-deoxy-7-phosphoheptulonate synthase [Bacillota bacterium]
MKGLKLAVENKAKNIIKVKDAVIGGSELVLMAGPCAVESKEQLLLTAQALKELGVKILRGGAFKPRTSPYSFLGLGQQGLELLKEVADDTGMAVVTEVMDPNEVQLVAEYADILQIGSRNMQNFPLLQAVGKINKPILLKRGLAATLSEWLFAAEYILAAGNNQIILCERGIRTFETYTRNTVDLSIVPIIQSKTSFPIIVDPSHATGIRELVLPVSKGAVAIGADGLMIEVHPNPAEALCDGEQSLTPTEFAELLKEIKPICAAVGKTIS